MTQRKPTTSSYESWTDPKPAPQASSASGSARQSLETHPSFGLWLVAGTLAKAHGTPSLPGLLETCLVGKVMMERCEAAHQALVITGTLPSRDGDSECDALVKYLTRLADEMPIARRVLNKEYIHWREIAEGLEYDGESFDTLIPRYGPGSTILDYLDRAMCGGHGSTRFDPNRGRRIGIRLNCELLAKNSKTKASDFAGRIKTSKRSLEFWRPIWTRVGAINSVAKDGSGRVLYAPAWFRDENPREVLLDILKRLVELNKQGKLTRSNHSKTKQTGASDRLHGEPAAIQWRRA